MPTTDPNKKKHNPLEYMKYAGIAFQMGAIILIGVLVGDFLDGRYATEKPYFTLSGVLIALVAAFYITLKDLLITPKK